MFLSVKFFSDEKEMLIGSTQHAMTPMKSPLFAPELQKYRYMIDAHDDKMTSVTALARKRRDTDVG